MATSSAVEKLAKESRDRAIKTAMTLFRLPKEYPNELIETMIDSTITAMMEIASMQMKIVEEGK